MRHAFAPFSVTLSKALDGGPKTAFVHASWILVKVSSYRAYLTVKLCGAPGGLNA